MVLRQPILLRCLTLVQRWLLENELLVKLLRAPFQMPSKVCHEIQFYIPVFLPKSSASLHSPSVRRDFWAYHLRSYCFQCNLVTCRHPLGFLD